MDERATRRQGEPIDVAATSGRHRVKKRFIWMWLPLTCPALSGVMVGFPRLDDWLIITSAAVFVGAGFGGVVSWVELQVQE